jgi:hypothetical protein
MSSIIKFRDVIEHTNFFPLNTTASLGSLKGKTSFSLTHYVLDRISNVIEKIAPPFNKTIDRIAFPFGATTS